jgi:hypothetical protein
MIKNERTFKDENFLDWNRRYRRGSRRVSDRHNVACGGDTNRNWLACRNFSEGRAEKKITNTAFRAGYGAGVRRFGVRGIYRGIREGGKVIVK